jgi:hypothetical protein
MIGKEKQEQFLKELNLLLVKYNAELYIEDFGDYLQDWKMFVDFNFDETLEDGEIVPQLIIGSFLDGR